MMIFEATAFSSLQDLGRAGLQNQGIGESGAMDRMALRVANSVLGNPESFSVIEITMGGTRIRILDAQWFALTGADLSARLNGQEFPLCRPVFTPANSVLELQKPLRGCRAYLAVQGGFAVDPILGSVATDVRAGLGGLDGQWLKRHDRLAYNCRVQHIGRQVNWHTSYANPAFEEPGPLRLIPDRLWHGLSKTERLRVLAHEWHIAPDSDRMGMRLAETLPHQYPEESMLSSAVAFGSVQIPPDRRPIILGADRQTTGGYPLLGTLASISHSALAQLKPGDSTRFEIMEIKEAQQQWRHHERSFREWQDLTGKWWAGDGAHF